MMRRSRWLLRAIHSFCMLLLLLLLLLLVNCHFLSAGAWRVE
jgi:hypothetical protein